MAALQSSASWQALGEVNYRKWVVYRPLSWDLSAYDLESATCACGPLGMAAAVVRDTGVEIYTMAGGHIATVDREHRALAQGGVGWTSDEHLVLVCCDGTVQTFDIRGREESSFSLLARDLSDSIERACVWSNGLVALTNRCKLYVVSGSGGDSGPRNVMALNGGKAIVQDLETRHPLSMAVLDPAYTRSEHLEVLIATADTAMLVVSAQIGAEMASHDLQDKVNAPVLKMAVAPNGRFVACFTADGWLTVLNTSFRKKVLEFDTKAGVEPLQLVWCGEDSVVMYWKQLGLLMVGPFGDWVKYTFEEALLLVQELDSCRILTANSLEMLQRVPAATDAICKIGSFAPAAMLFDAIEALESGDPKADENIRAIKDEGKLGDAVRDCLRSAMAEFDIPRQQALLRAAASGKSFCMEEVSEAERRALTAEFVTACNTLRVLNVVRYEAVGLPITAAQYERLTPLRLIDRLVRRQHHFLALKLCRYLRLPGARHKVLVHWACSKIRALSAAERASQTDKRSLHQGSIVPAATNRGLTGGGGADLSGGGDSGGSIDRDERLCTILRSKLSTCRGVSYVEVAACADENGRRRLATMLLERYEPRAADAVRQLLSMSEDERALRSAVASGDADLIYFTMLKVLRRYRSSANVQSEANGSGGGSSTGSGGGGSTGRELEGFFRLVAEYPLASDLLVLYCAQQDRKTLKEFLRTLHSYKDAGTLLVLEAYRSRELEKRHEKFDLAIKMFSYDKSLNFHVSATKEQTKLLQLQVELEQSTGEQCFVDYSVSETIFNCLVLKREEQARQIKTELKVSDKRFWMLKIKALAKCKDWDGLHRFAERRSPVGYLPFAEACIAAGERAEAAQYIYRVDDAAEQLSLFERTGHWDLAAEVACKLGDADKLVEIRSKCNSSVVIGKIDQLMAQLHAQQSKR